MSKRLTFLWHKDRGPEGTEIVKGELKQGHLRIRWVYAETPMVLDSGYIMSNFCPVLAKI